MPVIVSAFVLVVSIFWAILTTFAGLLFMPIILLMTAIGLPKNYKPKSEIDDVVLDSPSEGEIDDQEKKCERVAKIMAYTDNALLKNYKKNTDRAINVKNFRLYYNDQPTNLVWYSGKIIYVPKDYFLMNNLVNINHAIGEKCTLYKSDISLIDELKEKHIEFTLAEDLEDLMNRINAINVKGLLSEEVGIETTSDVDYSEFHESILDENGSWKIKF